MQAFRYSNIWFMQNIEVTYIIAFYNNIRFLRLILEALKKQSFRYFEVIIADDGSKDEIVAEIKNIKNNYLFDIIHLWQPDNGWHKNIILNRAIVESRTSYLIFTDGDCIPHPKFIQQHYQNRSRDTILTARRQNISEYVTNKLTKKQINNNYLQRWGLLAGLFLSFFGKGNHFECGLYIPNMQLKRFDNRKQRGILGCNFSVHKDNILKINGFDERYIGPGIGEDSDPDFRFRLLGFKIVSIKYMAIQYHLYHKELPRTNDNDKLFKKIKKEVTAVTPFGINKLKTNFK